MITEKDLQEAIAECQGQRNPNANTCIKLAAFLTIQKELYGNQEQENPVPETPPFYSYAIGPSKKIINYDGDSEFSKLINGKDEYNVFLVIDELMEMLRLLYPKIYNSVIKKLQ